MERIGREADKSVPAVSLTPLVLVAAIWVALGGFVTLAYSFKQASVVPVPTSLEVDA